MGLTLQNVGKIVDNEMHLEDINLTFESGSKNILLGRTQAGKTSLLRIMAGLDRPTTGKIIVDGNDVTGVSVRKRNIAMVYQQFINYPSLNIYKNIASPLKIIGMKKAEIDKRVRETAEVLHIEHLLDRLPAELSGGQQQRTAIARALVKDSQLLLMDEPLVNLDYKLREELRNELQDIFKKRDAIVVYTTTEPSEALMIGGEIVVLDEGCVLQEGKTSEVYHYPSNVKVAEVFSDPPISYINGSIGGNVVKFGNDIEFPISKHFKGISSGDYKFGIRSNHFTLTRQKETDTEITSKVDLAEINGSETFIHIRYGDNDLVIQEDGIHEHKLGRDISVFVDPDNMFVYGVDGNLVTAPKKKNI
ncbi:MAG: ABC transporter ATP-binding protein [Desulfobacterales bacterium]|nr:ABC transporter ATP-binding protein [Desulfobacterales bacterium]MCP4161766.1 ABC transporter ATP-binding protein [Deltaproteobacteria bacterium]